MEALAARGGDHKSFIQLPGKKAPPLAALPGETEVIRLQGGMRDVGLLQYLLGHRKELVITSHRIIQFNRKSRDYELNIIPLSRVDFFSGGSSMNAQTVVGGVLALAAGAYVLVNPMLHRMLGEGAILGGGLFALFGVISLLFARTRMFQFGAPGGKILFGVYKATDSETETVIHTASNSMT